MLLTPGPTPVPEFARVAMSGQTLHHRTPEFENIFKVTRELLLKMYNMPEVLILASSGTGAMEASLRNLCTKKALIVNSGKFGQRFTQICEAFDMDFIELKNAWDTPVCLNEVKKTLEQNEDIDTICVQICESSGGLRQPVEQLAKLAKEINPNIMIIADGITAFGVEKIDTKNIDAFIAGSQKAMMLPPGLSFIGLSQKAVQKLESSSKGYYFNLWLELKKQKQNTTAWTPATTLIIGLKAVLEKIEAKGLQNLYDDTALRARACKKALEALGLKIYPKTSAKAMNTVCLQNANRLRKILKDKYNVNIAGGQDGLKDKIFRINNMGFVKDFETSWVLNAIELTLDEMGIRKFDSTANKVFLACVYQNAKSCKNV